MILTERKTKIGLLLIGSPRFRPLGEGTPSGNYEQRQLIISERILASVRDMGDVVYPGIVYSREEMQKAMDLFYLERVDYVLATYMSWAEDFAWIRFLRDMPPMPILFASIVRDEIRFADTEDEDDFIEFLAAGGLVGTQEASGSIPRFGRPMMETVVGTLDVVMERARVFGAAARVRGILRQSTVGLLASYNEVMWSTYVDPYDIFSKIGPELRFLSVAGLMEEIDKVTPAEAQAVCDKLAQMYPVLPDVDMEKFRASVRASIALERLAAGAGVDLLVLNDIDPILLKHIGLRPGFCPIPDGEPVTVVPEGDIGGGLATYILKILSGRVTNFIEPFHIDHPGGCFAAGHAGPNDYTDPEGVVKISRDVRFAKSGYKHAGAPFAWYVYPPGEKTMLHCSQGPERFKLVTAQVEALSCKHFITSYSHGLLRPMSGTSEELFDKLVGIGVTQHYGLAPGNYTRELKYLASMMGFDFTAIL